LFNATSVIVDNPDLIKRPGFPVAVLPIVTVTTHLIHFLLALPILLIFLSLRGFQMDGIILILPFIILIQFILTLSLSYFVAAVHVNFRDTQYLLGIILLLGFYLSPIFYEIEAIPQSFQWVYHLNPMVDLIDMYRAILMQGQLPNLVPISLMTVFSLITLWAGYKVFTQASYRFVEEI
jgi:lipopolysaccharide transport system permease protein